MDIRQELHEALDEEDFPTPTLLARAMSRLEEPPRTSTHRWQALVAASLAVALVATFLVIRANREALNPADNGPTLPVSANIPGVVSFQFVSPQVGWLNIYTPAGDTVITRTSDGGRTWRRQLVLSGVSPTPTMQFFNDRDGVVIGQRGKIPTVWLTSDGGIHWQSHVVLVGADDAQTALPGWWATASGYFLDGELGWLLLRPDYGACSGCGLRTPLALVYQTSDGGGHWSRLATLTQGSTNNSDISFATTSTGFVLTDKSGVGNPVLYVTHDGGRTWTLARIPFGPPPAPGPKGFDVFIQAPILFSANYGLLVATLGAPAEKPCPGASTGNGCHYIVEEPVARYMYSSSDGGLSWSELRQIPTTGQLDFIDSHQWILTSVDGVADTVDGGTTWSSARALPTPSGWYVIQAHFLDAHRGWVTLSDEDPIAAQIAAHGATGAVWPKFAMLQTSDGGVTWYQVSLPTV